MAKLRHFIEKPGQLGPRYYWQPTPDLRAAGWQAERLPNDYGQAVARAEARNREVDDWRAGVPTPEAPARASKRRKATPGSVSALIVDYKASRFWSKLAPTTQASYQQHLDAIEAWAGDQLVRGVTSPTVQAFYELRRKRVEIRKEGKRQVRIEVPTPARGAASIRVLRLLLQAGERLGYIQPGQNPAQRPGISYQRAREPQLWSEAAVHHMAAVADRLGWHSMATAIILNFWCGQRLSDLLALGQWAASEESLRIRQSKTKRVVVLPVQIVPHLVERLREHAQLVGLKGGEGRLLCHDGTGEAWNRHTFAHVFAEVRAAAVAGTPGVMNVPDLPPMPECAGLLFMELRHTAVTVLHEAGADPLLISGITGHTEASVRAILDRHYLIRTEAAAERAFRARLDNKKTP